jgi:hypothetical protein
VKSTAIVITREEENLEITVVARDHGGHPGAQNEQVEHRLEQRGENARLSRKNRISSRCRTIFTTRRSLRSCAPAHRTGAVAGRSENIERSVFGCLAARAPMAGPSARPRRRE